MNYDELEKNMQSSITSDRTSSEEILSHFKEKYDMVPYNGDIMFVFHREREFMNKNHIISLHKRNNGRTPMHIFHYVLITYVYSDSLTMYIEQEKITLKQGDTIILDRHVPHAVEKTGPNDLAINIILNDHYFSKKFINRLPSDTLMSRFIIELMNSEKTHTHYLAFHTADDKKIHTTIQNILCEYFDYQNTSDDIIDNYIMILITYLARLDYTLTNISANKFKNTKLLYDILDYIKDHYKEGNLTTLCEYFGYDPSYTSKLIKKYSGKTFKQLVMEERMQTASILLQNAEMTIYDISREIGFNNLTSFYKKFEEYYHCTPQEYRKKRRT